MKKKILKGGGRNGKPKGRRKGKGRERWKGRLIYYLYKICHEASVHRDCYPSPLNYLLFVQNMSWGKRRQRLLSLPSHLLFVQNMSWGKHRQRLLSLPSQPFIIRICHEASVDRDCYPSPLNYYQFPKSCCTSVNEVNLLKLMMLWWIWRPKEYPN